LKDKEFFDEDSLLAKRASQGDQEAFRDLVKKYQGPIHGFALQFFRASDIAEDVAQETFLRAFRFLHTYDPSRKFLTWLYTIARNICIDKHRERWRKERVSIDDVPPSLLRFDSPEADPLLTVERKEEAQIMHNAIESLSEKYRTPIILCYLQGLSYQEISDVLGLSLSNTKIRIFRAKKRLLDLFEEEGEK
jgi:RNA polymerase sigma-70 factor (ECF subfamily)